MSPVEVRLPPAWRTLAQGRERCWLEGRDVGEIVRRLVEEIPGLAGRLTTPEGRLRSSVAWYLNDTDVRTLDREATRVTDGDLLVPVPALAGG